MIFSAFKMAEFSAQWQTGTLTNAHSSNPEPFSWEELAAITGCDFSAELTKSALGYEPVQGHVSLRTLISQQYYQHVKANDVVLTSGAQEGIFLVMHALLSSDDHAIAFTPCFEPLVQVARNSGARVTTHELLAKNHWQIDWDQLTNQFTSKTKLLIINFPHNPTGCHITSSDLEKLLKLCQQHDCWLFSDEVFRGLEHDNEDRLAAAVDQYPKAISMGVMSKALALPGIRLGWLCSQSPQLIKQINTIKSHLSICQSSLDAHLCQLVIPHSQAIWQRNLTIILENKKLISSHLHNNKHFYWTKPKASATAYIQLKHDKGYKFAQSLADNKQILVLPDAVFLTEQSGFRVSLGQKDMAALYIQIFSHQSNQ